MYKRVFPKLLNQFFSGAIKAVNPFLNRIPSENQESYVNDCLQELIDMSPKDEDGRVIANYNLTIAHLQREDCF